MKLAILKPIVLLLISLPSVTSGAPDLVLQTVAKINYKGLAFHSSPSDVKSTIPSATVNHEHAGSNEGITTFEVWNDPIIDCILLRFANDELIEMQYAYFPTKVAMMGGANAINALALREYGQPTERNDITMRWDFPSIDRVIEVSEANGKWTQRVLHRSRYLAFDAYPETTATPRAGGIHVARGPSGPPPRTSRSASRQRPPSEIAIPKDVRNAIERNARLDHPGNRAQQAYTIVNQTESYTTLMQSSSPDSFEPAEFKRLKAKLASRHPFNYSTQLSLLKSQISDREILQDLESPDGMARGHFFTLKKSAQNRYPGDYSTQLSVLRQNIDKYLQLRQSGNSGNAIMGYILKY